MKDYMAYGAPNNELEYAAIAAGLWTFGAAGAPAQILATADAWRRRLHPAALLVPLLVRCHRGAELVLLRPLGHRRQARRALTGLAPRPCPCAGCNFCRNGGSCTLSNGAVSCSCPVGYAGGSCELQLGGAVARAASHRAGVGRTGGASHAGASTICYTALNGLPECLMNMTDSSAEVSFHFVYPSGVVSGMPCAL
jgi:hypothetical protein